MRTIIDIPDEQLKTLDALCKQEGLSRAAMVRQGIDLLIAGKAKKKKGDIALHPAFGMWKDRKDIGNGLEYERKLRAEWDDRDREIDIRLGRVKPTKKK